MTIRKLEELEIKIAVDFYQKLLLETQTLKEQDILPTDENLKKLEFLIVKSYENGIPSFCCENDGIFIGVNICVYVPFFDLKQETVFSYGTYVIKEYRKHGIAKKIIEYSFDDLRKRGVERIIGKFFEERESSERIIKELGLERINTVCKIL